MKQMLRKRIGLIIVAMMTALLRCGTLSAQEMKPFLTLKTAKAMAEAADKKASDMGIKVHIAIVDDGGNLKFYLRQDGAPLVAEKISQMKAFTAVAMEKSTAEVGEISKAEAPGIVERSFILDAPCASSPWGECVSPVCVAGHAPFGFERADRVMIENW